MKKSTSTITRFRFIETIIYAIIWLTVISIPFFHHRSNNIILWDRICEEWVKMAALFIIFLLNVTVLVPRFLFTRKYRYYITGVLIILCVIIPAAVWSELKVDRYFNANMPPMEIRSGLPMELGNSMPAPEGYRLKKTDNEPTPFSIFADLLIFAVLLTGASTTLKLTSRWITEENMRREIEKEQLKTELTLLKYQVSPHFLMNTLNNIHALIDLDVDRAKDAVIKLSLLMRYLLYDSAHGKTTLRKELEFIESYISLMKIRYPKNVVVEYAVPSAIPDISIPPMLFISFLENAFKHGISYRAESYIHFKLEITAGNIICQIRNSKHFTDNEPTVETNKYSGIGLANIRKNLQLLYGDSYTLNINNIPNEFEVKLTLPLHREN